MANWNLSVDLRGNGNDLAQALKSAAKNARSLGTAARTAKTEVRELGQAAQTAGRHVRALGNDARTASRHINTLGDRAQTTARRLNRYGDAARTANRQLGDLGDRSRTAGRDLARMSGQIDGAVRDLLRLAQAAQAAHTRLNGVGDGGLRSMRRYREETGRVHDSVKNLAVLLSGGALTLGAADVVKEGNEYQQAMNAFGATTNATQLQMHRASAVANQLGNDLRLPGATAADAAEAMVELAKAGFRTDQAISSTRASLVLASAAQVNAADSAKYLGDMMDQFGMGADQAGTAADTLAATANAASGDIIDIYYAMKYAGPVAHGMGVDMREAASAVGMLGKAGILGQTAGTTLRGMLANLASPTAQMKEGLHDLGIEAFDAQGNFKGLRYVIDGLSKAQHRMSQQDFAAAVKKSMGKPAMAGAIALAHQGTESFDAMMQAVSQTGAASEIAAAKGKGLAGAMLQLKTQARQTGLTIYQGMAPGLEWLVRNTTTALSKATPKIEAFFRYFNDAATLFGPDIKAAVSERLSGIRDAAKDMMEPFKGMASGALAQFLHLLLNVGSAVVTVLTNLAGGIEPIVGALGDLSGESGAAASALNLVVTALDFASATVGALSAVLVPIGHVIGSLVSGFGSLPGPIQQFVLAALLIRRIQPTLTNLATSVRGNVSGAFRSLGEQMRVQQSLAASAGVSLSRYGAAFAVLQTRVPVIGRMGEAFRTASAQGTGFTGTLRGIGAASLTATRAMGSGLLGALGGPWGLALTAATVGLGYLAQRQQQAAQAAAEHQQRISSLSEALRESNGVVNESVRAIATQNLMQTKVKTTLDGQQRLVDVARKAKVPMSQLVDAYTNQGSALSDLEAQLKATSKAQTVMVMDENGITSKAFTVQGRAADDLRKTLGGLSGDFAKAAADAKDYNNGVKGTTDGISAYSRLKDAVGALADKTADADSRTRALRDALDLLSGGSVSLQAAQARVHEAITNANEAMKAGIDRADGWGKALLQANGNIDTTTKNGQQLFSTLNTIADGSASAAVAAYDFADSQGKSLPQALEAARGEMEKSRKAVIDMAPAYGLTAEQMGKVADSLGLIPGQVSILLSTEGVDTTLAELLAVQAEFEKVPSAKTVRVDALGEDAKKELEDLGYQIELIPGTREYKITAPTKDARAQLDQLIATMSKVPGGKNVRVDAKTLGAITSLEEVKQKVASTKGKTITINAPTAEARKQLEALGFKIQSTKGKTVTITAPTGTAQANVAALAGAISALRDRTVTITTNKVTKFTSIQGGVTVAKRDYANGGIAFANGGIQRGGIRRFATGAEDHVAQIAPGGSWRVWAEPETEGEGYVPFARSKRPRSRAITEEIVRRLGGDPRGIQWNADGSVTDWRYDPNTGSLYSASDAGQAGHKTKKVKVKGGKTKEVEYFDLATVEKKLKSISKLTIGWNNDLATVADRVGGDVADALAGMGEDGMALARKMAHGSTKYINEMATALRNLQKTAKASLTDYTRQLGKANSTNKAFQDNLARLAASGYGDLASQLAAQGDEAAQQLAAAAVKDKKKAAAANKQAKTANSSLTDEQVAELVQIIAAIKTSRTGIHDVAAATSLGEDEIIAVANKAKSQITKSLGSRASKFLADLSRANQHLSYADGGIRAGLYATRGGIVRFAEPETHGEAYLPLSPSKRRSALPVLADVAHRFGLGLQDVSAGRQVVVVRSGDTTNVTVTPVRTGATASDIGAQVGRSVRRARRGGVAARAA
ncbi:phage tail tape measure protein [Streptomyces achromogenes]|uniref:phage tail tape measure protein n=1 Tax=Streptomyces achromogenes TaxID=67255 RepID=UPI003A80FC30